MSLANYSDLKTAVADWMARADLSGNVADWITLAEARLNRTLGAVEVDQALTGTIDSRRIDVSAYSVIAPVALFRADTSTGDEVEVLPKADGTFAYLATSGVPQFWAMDGSLDYIDFDCPLMAAYTFRFRYRQRFTLSDSATTNWLLENYPDIYLAASLMWGSGYTKAFEKAGNWKLVLDEGIPEVRNIIARSKKSVSTVDPALVGVSPYFNGTVA